MLISIIIPTCRPDDYLWECLSSIMAQTFPKSDFETIIILNGCDEPWKRSIFEYLKNEMQGVTVRFYHSLICGVSNARNIGLEEAKGDFITFIDDDDIISPSYLQDLYDKAIKGFLPLSNLLCFDDNIKKTIEDGISKSFKELSKCEKFGINAARHYLSGPVAKLIPKDVAKSARFDSSLCTGEDTLYNFMVSRYYPKSFCCTSPNAVYYRRIRKDSASRNITFKDAFKQNLYAMKLYLKTWIKNPREYNFCFFFTRILGSCAGIIKRFISNIKY